MLVNIWRLPGYPLFVDLVFRIAGYGNLPAVSTAQALLFLLTTCEIFWLALLLFQHDWVAFVVGLLVGTNTMIIDHIKPLLSEALAVFLLTTLALSITFFIYNTRIWKHWLIFLVMILLVFTRPEWALLPIPLFLSLLLIESRQGNCRKLIQYSLHSLLAIILLYLCIAAYGEVNSVQNHFPGMSYRINYDVFGKVVRYHMQDETLPEDRPLRIKLDQCLNKPPITINIDRIMSCMPKHFKGNGASEAGLFAWAIILHHPVEFLARTFPLFFTTLSDTIGHIYISLDPTHDGQSQRMRLLFAQRTRSLWPLPAYPPLSWLQSFYRAFYGLNILFPICAATWVFLLWRKWPSCQPNDLSMGAIILCLLCGIIVTTLGAFGDFLRVHTVVNPLLLLVLWGSSLRRLCYLFAPLRARRVQIIIISKRYHSLAQPPLPATV